MSFRLDLTSHMPIEDIVKMIAKQTDQCVYSIINKTPMSTSLHCLEAEQVMQNLRATLLPYDLYQGMIVAYDDHFEIGVNVKDMGAISQVFLCNFPDQHMVKFLNANPQYLFFNKRKVKSESIQ